MRCPFERLDGCSLDFDVTRYGLNARSLARHIHIKHRDRVNEPLSFMFEVMGDDDDAPIRTTMLDRDRKLLFTVFNGWDLWEEVK